MLLHVHVVSMVCMQMDIPARNVVFTARLVHFQNVILPLVHVKPSVTRDGLVNDVISTATLLTVKNVPVRTQSYAWNAMTIFITKRILFVLCVQERVQMVHRVINKMVPAQRDVMKAGPE